MNCDFLWVSLALYVYGACGYYAWRWDMDDEIKNHGYYTLAYAVVVGFFSVIPLVNIVLCLIGALAKMDKTMWDKRFYK